MRSEFNEFSYGFAFTHGFLKDLPHVTTAPRFPSLVAEGKVGWDLKLTYPGLPIFFQYKLSDYLTRPQAKYWEYYKKPYFRFDITPRKRSNQHNLLKKLATKEEDVFYAAPLFIRETQFDQAYLQDQVANLSIWAPLKNLCWLKDDEEHHVTFTDPYDPRWHTEPLNLAGHPLEGEFSAEQNLARIRNLFEQNELRQIGQGYFTQLRDNLRNILNRGELALSNRADPADDPIGLLREIDYLLTSGFGLEMVVAYIEAPISG